MPESQSAKKAFKWVGVSVGALITFLTLWEFGIFDQKEIVELKEIVIRQGVLLEVMERTMYRVEEKIDRRGLPGVSK